MSSVYLQMSVFRSYSSCLKYSAYNFPLPKRSFYQERRNAGWMSLKAAIIPDFHLTARSYGANNSINSSRRQKKDLTPPIDKNDLVSLNKPKPNPGSRRPAGRPAGSKNKPSPLKLVFSGRPTAFQSHVLEVSDGSDIQEELTNFASVNKRVVCILSGSGTVTNVSLKQSASPDVIVSLQGRFEILSLSGSILPLAALPAPLGLTICLASGHGQVMGGCVVGPLFAEGPVVIMAASFENTAYEKLPLADKVSKVNNSSK